MATILADVPTYRECQIPIQGLLIPTRRDSSGHGAFAIRCRARECLKFSNDFWERVGEAYEYDTDNAEKFLAGPDWDEMRDAYPNPRILQILRGETDVLGPCMWIACQASDIDTDL